MKIGGCSGKKRLEEQSPACGPSSLSHLEVKGKGTAGSAKCAAFLSHFSLAFVEKGSRFKEDRRERGW